MLPGICSRTVSAGTMLLVDGASHMAVNGLGHPARAARGSDPRAVARGETG